MEKRGCGANTHSRTSTHVSLDVKMPFPAWEFCLMLPLLPRSLSPLRGDAKYSGKLQYHVALPLFFQTIAELQSWRQEPFVLCLLC